jgi:hypothetical protein
MKKSLLIRTTGLVVLTLVFTVLTISCQKASEKTGEKLMENALENATGQKADIDLEKGKAVIQTGDGSIEVDSNAKSWPSEIPGDVPEFKFGKVKAVTTSIMDGGKSWNVAFEEVQDGFLDKYEAQLKEKGFETIIIKMGDKGGTITAESDKYSVFLMGGEGNLSIGVTVKKEE